MSMAKDLSRSMSWGRARTRLCELVLAAGLMFSMAIFPAATYAHDIRIAAATELKFLFEDVSSQFEQKSAHQVSLVFANSGALFEKIKNGESFDLFFSSELRYPKRLEQTGEGEPGTLYRFGISGLVIWVPKESKLDLQELHMNVLLDPAVKKVAIPDPSLEYLGKAAFSALSYFKLEEQVQNKFILTDTSWMAARYVESGAAEVAIIPLSLAAAPAMQAHGRYWEIPRAAYPPIEVSSIILRDAPHRDSARAFLLYLNSKTGRELMHRYGFLNPR